MKPVKEATVNAFQVCNQFQINGRNRRITEKKYANKLISVAEWKKLLEKDKLL